MSLDLVLTAWPVLLLGLLSGILLEWVVVLALRRLRRSPRSDRPRGRRRSLKAPAGRWIRTFAPVLVACLLWGGFFGIVTARYLAPAQEPAPQTDFAAGGESHSLDGRCPRVASAEADAPRCRVARPLPVLVTPSAIDAPVPEAPATPAVPLPPPTFSAAPATTPAAVAAIAPAPLEPSGLDQRSAVSPAPEGAIVLVPIPWPAAGLSPRDGALRPALPRPPRSRR